MKDGKNSVSLNLNLLNEKTSFEKLEENLKASIFGVLYVLLKNQSFSIWVEIIFVIIQLLQFMAFPFRPLFNNIWKQENTYGQVSNFLQYFQIVVFFQDNSDMYIIAFYVCICLVILLIINIVYVSISFSRNKFNVMWPLRLLRSIISFLVSVMFLPIFELFISIFNCIDNPNGSGSQINFYAPAITCWEGAHYIHLILSIIVSIAFVIICVIVQLTYYETKTSTHNQSAKSSSKSDVFMLLCKIISVLLFGFFGNKSSQWILIIVIFFLSAFMFISYYDERPYYSDKIMKVYLVCTGLYLWTITSLLLGKILEFSFFNGSLPMFFLGTPLIIAIILTNYDNKLAILLTNINKFQKGEKVIKQVNYFLEMVDKRDFDRNSKVLLKGYIYMFEESCTFQDCALKKFLYASEHNMDTMVFLVQHAESLYQTGISKFPNCTALRVSFAFFLLERMNKKAQANLELLNTEKYSPRFEEQFIIYRYKKLLEEQSSEVGDADDSLDVVSNIAYKNHFNQFKNSITKVATLYMDFWSLLLNPNQDNNEDLAKLNDYGSKINVLVEEINDHFDKMQKLKHNDQEVIRLYSDFLFDILNDKEKGAQFKSRLNELDGAKQNYDEANLMNIDINALQSSDEYQYLIMSAQPEKMGTITNISLGLCSTFGYTRSEVIGKNIEAIMPEVFHKSHKKMLAEKINEYKKIAMSQQASKNFKPTFKDVISFGKNKSRYLVPFHFKVTYVPNNESNDSVFLGKLASDNYNAGSSTNSQQACYILTNVGLIIQNFTANAINILGLNSNAINNGNMEITRFIKEFQEEFIKFNVNMEDNSPEQLLMIKRHVLMSKFKNPSPITWKKLEDVKSKSGLLDMAVDKSGMSKGYKDSKIQKESKFVLAKQDGQSDETLIMSVQDIHLLGSTEAYSFKFELVSQNKDQDMKGAGANDKAIIFGKGGDGPQLVNNSEVANLNIGKEISRQMSDGNVIKETPGNATDEGTLKIDKSFVPEKGWNFHLDPKKMSFTVNPKNLDELREVIKEEALKKIAINREPTVNESLEESEYSSDYSKEESKDYSQESSIESEKSSKRKLGEEGYYTISFNNIKFLIYDNKKETLIEVMDWVKESQVEFKKTEDFKTKQAEESKPDQNIEKKDNLEGTEEEVVGDQGKEGILIKQIEYALSKEESQPTITRMKWISFFVFLICVGIATIFLVLFLGAMSWVIENVTLVYNTYDLIENTIYGIFHTRELVLLNNPKYNNIYQTSADYIKNNTDVLLNLFASSHDLLTNVITTFLTFTNENEYVLNNKTIYTTILQDDLSIKKFNLTLSSSFIETNTALYHTAHLAISDIIMTNKDIFFYLYNSLNDVSQELFIHALVFINELGYNATNFQSTFLYIFIGATVFAIVAYFVISMAYVAVEKRKESYLEVFFEIGGNVIKNSLEKCENFSKKIQSDNLSDATSNFDKTELVEENNVQQVSTAVKKQSLTKKRKTNNSKEARIIKAKLGSGMILLSAFFFIVYFIYKTYLDTVQIYTEIYKNTCLEQSEYLKLFNTLREYFFDYMAFVDSKPVYTHVNDDLNSIYSFKLERETIFSANQDYFPAEFSTLYSKVINNNICSYSADFFSTFLKGVDCQTFVSNSSSYGLNILLTNYVEEMRYAKFKFDLLLQKAAKYSNYTFNNTLKGSALNPAPSNDPLYDSIDPFQIFNDASHKNLVILNRYLLRPAYVALKQQLKTSIDDSMNFFQTVYIVVFSIFISSLVVIYLFIWRPFENGLNQTIYKTKNMLSIIPKEVLASLSNIHKLLDIGQNFAKNKRMIKS